MRRCHQEELDELGNTYNATKALDITGLQQAISDLSDRGVLYVASGGALSTAQLGARLHTVTTGNLSIAVTPLQSIAEIHATSAAIVIVSARAKHPDVLAVAEAAHEHPGRPVLLLTTRRVSDLSPQLLGVVDAVAEVPSTPDGFLATNSVLAMSTALVRSYRYPLPDTLPALHMPMPALPINVKRLILVYTPGAESVGRDFETRLAETGLADVQVCDIRNFAHGRYVGLARQADTTGLIFASLPNANQLTEQTLRYLPDALLTKALRTDLMFPAGTLDLLVSGIRLVGAMARDQQYDIGQPGIPEFGRHLYHLRWDPRCLYPASRVTAAATDQVHQKSGHIPVDFT